MAKRFVVFAEKKIKGGSTLTRAGNAVENRDGSIIVYLDVLPLDGTLLLRLPVGTEKELTPEEQEIQARGLGHLFGMGGPSKP